MVKHLHQGNVTFHTQELLAELNLGPMRNEVPSLAVSLALEAKASHRELTSRLLSDLCGPVLSRSDMENSFDKLLRELPDLVLDTPGAPQVSYRKFGEKSVCTFSLVISFFTVCVSVPHTDL